MHKTCVYIFLTNHLTEYLYFFSPPTNHVTERLEKLPNETECWNLFPQVKNDYCTALRCQQKLSNTRCCYR